MFDSLPLKIINLSGSTINLLRDLSLEKYKKQDFKTSEYLAMLCYLARPNKYTQERVIHFSNLRMLMSFLNDKEV